MRRGAPNGVAARGCCGVSIEMKVASNFDGAVRGTYQFDKLPYLSARHGLHALSKLEFSHAKHERQSCDSLHAAPLAPPWKGTR